jgi:hypothetical protein
MGAIRAPVFRRFWRQNPTRLLAGIFVRVQDYGNLSKYRLLGLDLHISCHLAGD